MFGFSVREIVSNILGNLVADAITPAGMIGWAVTIGLVVWYLIHWHRGQRANKKPGMASWQFIALAFTVALIATAFGGYSLGLKFSEKQPAATASIPSKTIAPTPAIAGGSILISTRYYSKKNKEEVSGMLDTVSDAINKIGGDVLSMAEIAINRSPWDRPGEDTNPYLQRLDDIANGTVTLHRALYDDLYNNYPDYRLELNALLFPKDPFTDFQMAVNEFRNGLAVWSALNGTVPVGKGADLRRLVGASRMTFGVARDKFVAWLQQRKDKIDQTRRALRNE